MGGSAKDERLSFHSSQPLSSHSHLSQRSTKSRRDEEPAAHAAEQLAKSQQDRNSLPRPRSSHGSQRSKTNEKNGSGGSGGRKGHDPQQLAMEHSGQRIQQLSGALAQEMRGSRGTGQSSGRAHSGNLKGVKGGSLKASSGSREQVAVSQEPRHQEVQGQAAVPSVLEHSGARERKHKGEEQGGQGMAVNRGARAPSREGERQRAHRLSSTENYSQAPDAALIERRLKQAYGFGISAQELRHVKHIDGLSSVAKIEPAKIPNNAKLPKSKGFSKMKILGVDGLRAVKGQIVRHAGGGKYPSGSFYGDYLSGGQTGTVEDVCGDYALVKWSNGNLRYYFVGETPWRKDPNGKDTDNPRAIRSLALAQ